MIDDSGRDVDPAALALSVRRARRAALPPRRPSPRASLPADVERAAMLDDLADAPSALADGLAATVAAWARGDADPAPRERAVPLSEAFDARLDAMLDEREARGRRPSSTD